MSFKTLPQTTMDRVREARRREIAAQEEKAQRLSEQAAKAGPRDSQKAFAAMAEAGDKADGSSRVSSRRARAASNHSAKLGKPSAPGAAGGSADFDPFAESAPAPAPAPAPAAHANFDPFADTGAAPSESPAAASHASSAAASDPFDFGGPTTQTHTSPEDDLATLNFSAPAQPAAGGTNGYSATPSNASVGGGSVSTASSATGKPLYDLDDLTGVRSAGASATNTPKKAAPSMAELARINAANAGKKPVMMSSAASTPSNGGGPPQHAYGGGQQHGPPGGYFAPQQGGMHPQQYQQPGMQPQYQQYQRHPQQARAPQQQQQQQREGGDFDPFAGF